MRYTMRSVYKIFYSTLGVHKYRFIEILKVVLLISLIYAPIVAQAQSKLDQSKKEIKRGRDKNADNNENSSNNNSEDSFFECIITEAFLFITYHAFIGDEQLEYHLLNNLSQYPYLDGVSGNYTYFDTEDAIKKRFRLDVENSVVINFDRTIGNHLNLKIRPGSRFYFQGDITRLMEVPGPNNPISYLSLYNLDYCYDRLRFEKFNMGWSIGFKYMGEEVDKYGFTIGLSAECFISKPLSLTSSLRFGRINKVPVNQIDFKLKYYNLRYFYFLGYEYYKLATPKYRFVAIGAGLYI